MNGSLGRDRVWNDYIWSEMDKAVREEVGRVRVAQKSVPVHRREQCATGRCD